MNVLDSGAEALSQVVGNVEEKLHLKEFKYLMTIAVVFVSILLISNVASSKILVLGPFEFDGGTILFPLSYIFGDILTEVYGYKRTRKVIWLGLAMALLMGAVFMIVGALPASEGWGGQEAYMAILGWTPRIVLASVIAYAAGEFSNSYILAKVKIWMNGRHLWVRTIGSTLIGEGVDTLIFVFVAFYGASWATPSMLLTIIVSNYIFKVGVEVLFTPVTYAIVGFLKKNEGVDVYDKGTNFNPFRLN
ncbi:MAG: queuosine precursor transporter [Nanoarchaeota archaeon]|nr:queuosine precursor transporter [Nanoarchaeota archaeon]